METKIVFPTLIAEGKPILLDSFVNLLALSLICDDDHGIKEGELEEKEEKYGKASFYLAPLIGDASEDSLTSLLIDSRFFSEEKAATFLRLLARKEISTLEAEKRYLIQLLRLYYDLEEISSGIQNYGQRFYFVEEGDQEDFRKPIDKLSEEEKRKELETMTEKNADDDEDIRKFKNAVRRWIKNMERR